MSKDQKAIITSALSMYHKGDIEGNSVRAMLALIGMQVMELGRDYVKIQDSIFNAHTFTHTGD